MFLLDLNNDQYNLKDELDIRDCKYVELDSIQQSRKEKNDLQVIQLNIRGLLNKPTSKTNSQHGNRCNPVV